MKFEPNKKYTTIAIYALLVLVSAMLFFNAFMNVGVLFGWFQKTSGYIQPFVNGLIFAFLLNPLLRFMDDRLLARMYGDKLKPRHRRFIALFLTYLTALVAIGLFVALVVPQLITSIKSIADNVPAYFKTLEGLYAKAMKALTDASQGTDEINVLLTNVLARVVESIEGLLERTNEYLSSLLMSLLSATQRITTGIINMLLGVIVSIYLLMDREKLFAQLKKILRAIFSGHVYNLLLDVAQDAQRILSNFVVGKIIDSVIIGILCFFGMSILKLPYPVLIGVIVGVTNVIPYFGPFIGAIPSFIIICVHNPMQSIWFLIFILILQQFDGNILGPKILGDSIGLSALWVMFSIMLFSGLLGIAGMFIGVPLFAIIYSLLKRLISFMLERKGESGNTRDYGSEKNPLIK